MRAFIILFIGVLLIGGALFLFSRTTKISTQNQYQGLNKPGDSDIAIEKAQQLYNQKKTEGADLGSSQCLSEELMPDWSLQLENNPKTSEDNNPKNQCQDFRSGKTHHLVEMDFSGNVIQAQ